ncbi:cupin domain-containing protein [Membranihabitans marinus]|uniref:cupin domain-containing protein n=1 Tax=Membranihabitans marinus TaxID=1227546 RepID=UPI001F2D8B7E|nr:cupin domain-containing protein [Membranihabitans marinus]
MNRKTFIKSSGLGLGLAFIPSITKIREGGNGLKAKVEAKIIRDHEGEVLNVIGDIQTHKLLGSDTDNQIVEWMDDVEVGVGIPPHVHSKEDEIFRVIKGEIEITVGSKTTILRAGDMAYAPKNIPHTWKVVGTEKAKMCTTAFPAGIEHMFNELSKLPEGPPNFPVVAEICGRYGIKFV